MNDDPYELLERTTGKKLYNYQQEAIAKIFDVFNTDQDKRRIIYQLPTGGGKTVIFSEIAKRFILENQKKVLILTHRIELCNQTSKVLTETGVTNTIIDSSVKSLEENDSSICYVAMVETLNNRLNEEKFTLSNIGMVIIDEAHYNSFRKLFKFFKDEFILGVTATPLSSNFKLHMNDNYQDLIVGKSIGELIDNNFLARATTYVYDVNLDLLTIGMNGDYTVSSSERLYSDFNMQTKLLSAYQKHGLGKKTLIFNNGINTSVEVYNTFKAAGFDIKHLDNKNTPVERKEIIEWFRNKPDAILTSVSILTMGFDEPEVEVIMLNRATRSLTLYHQMIGRGSRKLPNKSEFTIIDLGNNISRFGAWDMPIDWMKIFKNPGLYYDNLRSDEEIQRHFKYNMPEEIRKRFNKSQSLSFDVDKIYKEILAKREKPKRVLELSLEQHISICIENAEDVFEAIELSNLLDDDIAYRIRLYSYHINGSKNYIQWLDEDYKRKLKSSIRLEFARLEQLEN